MAKKDSIFMKVPILGNPGTGKTTLFNRLRNQAATHNIDSFTFSTSNSLIFHKYSFSFQLWDPDGTPMKFIRSYFYRSSAFGIILYDVSDQSKKSYNDVIRWVYRLWQFSTSGYIPLLLIGNKIDVRKLNIPTLTLSDCDDITKHLSDECNMKIPQIEISATTGENCSNILEMGTEIYMQYNKNKFEGLV